VPIPYHRRPRPECYLSPIARNDPADDAPEVRRQAWEHEAPERVRNEEPPERVRDEAPLYPVHRADEERLYKEHYSHPLLHGYGAPASQDKVQRSSLCGLRPVVFWICCAIGVLLVVGATVVGFVGGSLRVQDEKQR
jgi:hypothetical protein